MKLKALLHDVKLFFSGGIKTLKYFFNPHDCSLCLGHFYGESKRAMRGKGNTYKIGITNTNDESFPLLLSVQISPARKNGSLMPGIAHFSKKVNALCKNSTSILMEYDWMHEPWFTINGERCAPDDSRCIGTYVNDVYALDLILYRNRKVVDKLRIYQQLMIT